MIKVNVPEYNSENLIKEGKLGTYTLAETISKHSISEDKAGFVIKYPKHLNGLIPTEAQ